MRDMFKCWEWNALGGTEAWSQMGDAINGKLAGDLSGWSVSLSDDGSRLAVGGIEEDGDGDWKGHVRVYEWNATADAWVQLGEDFTGDVAEDYFGTSVSLSADGAHVAIGASEHDMASAMQGIQHRTCQGLSSTTRPQRLGTSSARTLTARSKMTIWNCGFLICGWNQGGHRCTRSR